MCPLANWMRYDACNRMAYDEGSSKLILLEGNMLTTLAIDDDVLDAAKGLASLQSKSIGEVISALARQALQPQEPSPATRNGVPLLQKRTGTMPVTLEMVNKLRDEPPHGIPA